MGKNPFFGDDYEPEQMEPVNPFLYPERVEERAKVADNAEQAPARIMQRKRGRPRKP
jgi:hypothetical protein